MMVQHVLKDGRVGTALIHEYRFPNTLKDYKILQPT